MKKGSRILAAAGCLLLLIMSWFLTVTSKSADQRQLELVQTAVKLMQDGIYIRAVPLLEEASSMNAAHTQEAEEELKIAYLELLGNRGFGRRYVSLLEKQMSRRDAKPGVFVEAAAYYLENSRISDALKVLKAGIEQTGSPDLIAMYEVNRYATEMSRTSYEYVAAIHGSTVQVQADGLWGIAESDGVLLIPCEYEKISTFDAGSAVVMRNGEVYAVDKNNNRIARLYERGASDIGNFANGRIPVFIGGVWRRSTGDLAPGNLMFEQIGMYSGGYAAAKVDGKWGVIGMSSEWLIEPLYDGIIRDELGKCYAQGAVFVQTGGEVYLFIGNRRVGEAYEDARPFSAEGYAAVKREGIWGYIDNAGNPAIDFQFQDALSFGQHLAAVEQNGAWGYINLSGTVVIQPQFIEAKSFSNGSAPVLTERGWQFITLIEYKKGVSL